MLLKNNVGTLSTDKSYSWFTAGCFLTTKHSNTLTEHANEGLHAPFAIGDLPSVASPTCCPRAWQPFLPHSLQHEPWLQAPVLPLWCRALTQFFHMPQLILTGWWDEQPQGKVLIPTQLLPHPKAVSQALLSPVQIPTALAASLFTSASQAHETQWPVCDAVVLPQCCRSLCPCHRFLT